MSTILKVFAAVAAFLGPVSGSVQGFLKLSELERSVATALGSASFVGLALTLVNVVGANAGAIFPNPVVAALVSFAMVQLGDTLRRTSHGNPIVTPAPAYPKADFSYDEHVGPFLDAEPPGR